MVSQRENVTHNISSRVRGAAAELPERDLCELLASPYVARLLAVGAPKILRAEDGPQVSLEVSMAEDSL